MMETEKKEKNDEDVQKMMQFKISQLIKMLKSESCHLNTGWKCCLCFLRRSLSVSAVKNNAVSVGK